MHTYSRPVLFPIDKRLLKLSVLSHYIITVLFFITSVEAETIQTIQKEYFSWRMENEPEYGTYLGRYAFNDRVYSYNISMFEVRRVSMPGFAQL